MNIPDLQQVLKIHQSLVELFNNENNPISPPGTRDLGLLQSACSRPHTGFGDREKYRTKLSKLAALFHSLVKNHAFHNGNKRTALATLLIGLSNNDFHFKPEVSDETIFSMVLGVSRNSFPDQIQEYSDDQVVDEIQRFIRNSTEQKKLVGEVEVDDFLDRIKESGGKVKESGSSWVIINQSSSVRFSRSNSKLDGNVAKRYLTTLKFVGPSMMISFDEFMNGGTTKRTEMQRYMTVFHRLADA
jgi:death-on-curing protein